MIVIITTPEGRSWGAGARQHAQAELPAAQGGEGCLSPGPHCRPAQQQQGERHHRGHGRVLHHSDPHQGDEDDWTEPQRHHVQHIYDEAHCPLQE